MKKLILPFILYLNISSQTSKTIVIVDKLTNSALSNVKVHIDGQEKFRYSDSEGKVSITANSNDDIQFSLNNYRDIIIKYKNLKSPLTLISKPFYSNEILVSSTRLNDKQSSSSTLIDKEKLKLLNTGKDITYMLQNEPSVIVSSDAGNGIGYSSIRIRGTDPTRVNVTINGIPLNDSESQGVWWVNMPDFTSSVESIQIQRGSGTTSIGAGSFGGSINILTTNFEQSLKIDINQSFGSFNTHKNTIKFNSGILDEAFVIDARYSSIKSDGYIDRASSDLDAFFLSGSYFGKNYMIKSNVIYGKEKSYQAWNGVPKDSLETNRTYNVYTYENQTDNYWQNHYQLFYNNTISNKEFFNLGLNYTHGEGYYEEFNSGQTPFDYNLTTWYFNNTSVPLDIIRRKWLDNDYYVFTSSYIKTSNTSEFNIGGLISRYNGNHFGNLIQAQNGSTILSTKKYQYYFNDAKKDEFNLYTKITHNLTNKLILNAEIQARQINYNFEHEDSKIQNSVSPLFLNPKTGITYQLNQNNIFTFSYSKTEKEPNRNDYIDSSKDNLPKSELLNDLEIGYKYNNKQFRFNSNYYLMYYKDQLVLNGQINDVGAYNRVNVNDSYRQGIEITANYSTEQISSYINATFSENKILNYTEYTDDYDTGVQRKEFFRKTDLSFSPSTIISFGFKYLLNQYTIGLDSKYVSRQYLDNTTNKNRSIEPYFINNLTLSANYNSFFTYISSLNINLQINNLLNESYETNGWTYRYFYENKMIELINYYPQAMRNIMFTINLSLGKNE